MTTITMCPYRGEVDLEAIANLINTCEAVDQLDSGTSIPELRRSLNQPSLDPARDFCLWEDTNHQLLAFSGLRIPPTGDIIDGFLWFRVHPTARGGDLEQQVIAWAQERLREVGQERNVSVKLRSGSHADKPERIALLESCGFTAERYFFSMARSLNEPIPEPQLPEGFTLRHRRGDEEAEAWVEMYNQSFIDHWNHHELTVERVLHESQYPYYKPELDLIAVAADGTFAAFCYCKINSEKNQRNKCSEGWIITLGTRRGFRQRGLGRAMLLAGMQQLKAQGIQTAKLDVDADNPHGAGRLYESVGFCKLQTMISFVKDV